MNMFLKYYFLAVHDFFAFEQEVLDFEQDLAAFPGLPSLDFSEPDTAFEALQAFFAFEQVAFDFEHVLALATSPALPLTDLSEPATALDLLAQQAFFAVHAFLASVFTTSFTS